jgi:DNA-binding XRE family transcriptional regulator
MDLTKSHRKLRKKRFCRHYESEANIFMKKNLTSLSEFKDHNFGPAGTPERDDLDAGYQDFKIGALLLEKRLELGLTQQELADKVGTTKSYISKIENNLKEARISTVQKIVERGFGCKLEIVIR